MKTTKETAAAATSLIRGSIPWVLVCMAIDGTCPPLLIVEPRRDHHAGKQKGIYPRGAKIGMTMTTEERDDVLQALRSAVDQITRSMHPALIPEVGTNIVYAIRDARNHGDVAAVEGRIVRAGGKVTPVGQVAFGASDHVARIVLTAMKFDPGIRSAANIRYSPGIMAVIEDLYLEVCSFDRGQEPPGTKTMDWGVAFCCKHGVPDVIFDTGGIGKEAMVRILGEDPLQVATTIGTISSRMPQGEPAQ